MKTTIKLLGGMMLLLCITSCEKDEFNPILENDSTGEDLKTYNNGMIKSYSNDAVIKWTEALSQVLDNKIPQPSEARIYAMVNLAIHDALNNVVPKYETYALENVGVNASKVSKKNIHAIADAAVAQAAHSVMSRLYPPSRAIIDQLLETELAAIFDLVSKDKGILIGQEAANAILLKRQTDFPFGFSTFVGPSGPGMYQADYMPYAVAFPPVWPANAVFGANVGDLNPFGIESANQFRDEGPYPINSNEYTIDYNEVKTLGCAHCPQRTAEQTEMAFFWNENNPSMMSRNARTLVTQEGLNGWEAARLLGLVQMAVMDSYIASFDGMYHYNFWRPITAIRQGDSDGNPDTVGDLQWTSLIPTAPTPEFPSTYSYSAAATATIFRHYFKKDVSPFTAVSPYKLPGVERTISSFDQFANEISASRIYTGMDFRHSTEVGKQQGHELGKYVFANNLRELK